jgi:hypothetical protein
VLSADGRFVAFTSGASNLVPNDTNGVADAFCTTAIPTATPLRRRERRHDAGQRRLERKPGELMDL